MHTWHQKNQLGFDDPFIMIYTHQSIMFQKHWHEEIEVIYIKRGSAVAEISGSLYEIGEGDIIFVGSKECHQYSSECKEGVSLIFDIGTAVFGKHREKMANSVFRTHVIKKPSPRIPGDAELYHDFVRLFESVIGPYESKAEAYDLFLRAKVLELSWLIMVRLELAPASHIQKIKQTGNEKMNEAFRYIRENYHQDLDLNLVAGLCNFSPSHFARLFRESAGVSFCKYLSDYRVRRARTLLAETDNTITEITFSVGFRSMQTFERVFKSAFGLSPSDYRRLGSGG